MRTVGCSPRKMTKPDGASRPMRGAQPLIRRWCGATAPGAAHRQGIRAACVKFQSSGGWVRPGLMRRSRLAAVQATEETKSSGIKRTLADLDSLLGIEEEPKKEDKKESVDGATDITVSAAWMKEVVDTEIEMLEQELGKTLDKEKKKEFQKRLTSQMEQIVEQAKKMKEGEAESPSDAVFQQEVRQLQQMFDEDVGVSRDDLSKIKETVGSSRMYITESRIIGDTELLEGWCNVQQEDRGCAIIRGNMRDTPQAILADLSAKVDEKFNGRYKVFLIPDVTEDMQEQQSQRRGALKILPAGLAQPRSTSWLAYLLAFFCALLALFTTFQLGVIAASPLLPKETAQFISNPDNLNLLWEQPDLVPPGLPGLSEDLPASWWATTTNVAMAVGASQLVGDAARQLMAGVQGLKMGPTFIVPSLDLGLFGSAQPIKSTIASNRQLWALAASGPTAAGLVAFNLFIVGFLLSMDPANLGDAAVPLPSFLRQGSLLLGAVTNTLANVDGQIMVHPLLIGGFVGMYAVALNLLPIGSLAGGRMMQASFGRNGQAVASFLVYIGLGFGLLGSFVSLPFGLYVLCFQRLGERHIQDTLTEVGEKRATLTLVFVLLSILILFPFDPVVLTNMDTVGGIVGPDQL